MPFDFQEIIFRVYFIINTYKIFKIEFYIVSSSSTLQNKWEGTELRPETQEK